MDVGHVWGSSLVLLLLEAGVPVLHLDVQLGGTLNDGASLLGRHITSNHGSVGAVVHQQDIQILDVENAETVHAVLVHVSGLGVASITTAGHGDSATEATTDASINALGLPPALRNAHEAVRLVSEELLGALLGVLEVLWSVQSLHHGG